MDWISVINATFSEMFSICSRHGIFYLHNITGFLDFCLSRNRINGTKKNKEASARIAQHFSVV